MAQWSVDYFNMYHQQRMDELKLFVETEAWTLCPLPVGYAIVDMPEFVGAFVTVDVRDTQLTDEFCLLDATFDNPFELTRRRRPTNASTKVCKGCNFLVRTDVCAE
jgi:hypothetical protein